MLKIMELFSYADIQKFPGPTVFIGLEKSSKLAAPDQRQLVKVLLIQCI
jgi:hypothetical protein